MSGPRPEPCVLTRAQGCGGEQPRPRPHPLLRSGARGTCLGVQLGGQGHDSRAETSIQQTPKRASSTFPSAKIRKHISVAARHTILVLTYKGLIIVILKRTKKYLYVFLVLLPNRTKFELPISRTAPHTNAPWVPDSAWECGQVLTRMVTAPCPAPLSCTLSSKPTSRVPGPRSPGPQVRASGEGANSEHMVLSVFGPCAEPLANINSVDPRLVHEP